MTEDSTPYHLLAKRFSKGETSPTSVDGDSPQGTLRERRISVALTHSEWLEIKIALATEIDRQRKEGTYTASRLEQLQELLTRLREEIEID